MSETINIFNQMPHHYKNRNHNYKFDIRDDRVSRSPDCCGTPFRMPLNINRKTLECDNCIPNTKVLKDNHALYCCYDPYIFKKLNKNGIFDPKFIFDAHNVLYKNSKTYLLNTRSNFKSYKPLEGKPFTYPISLDPNNNNFLQCANATYKFTNFNHECNGAVSHKQRIARLKFNNAVAPYLYNYNVKCPNRNSNCFQSYYKNKEKDPQRCRPKRIKGKPQSCPQYILDDIAEEMIEDTIDTNDIKPLDDVYSNSTIQATIQISESLVTLVAVFSQAHHWSYKLDNDYYPTIVNEGNHVEIENVTYGNHVLLVYALDNDDSVLATDVVHFNVDYGIPPPDYEVIYYEYKLTDPLTGETRIVVVNDLQYQILKGVFEINYQNLVNNNMIKTLTLSNGETHQMTNLITNISLDTTNNLMVIQGNGIPNYIPKIAGFDVTNGWNDIANGHTFTEILLLEEGGINNPNGLSETNEIFKIPLTPQENPDGPSDTTLGTVGIALNGIPIYNPFENSQGEDAYGRIFSSCCGHPQQDGIYHYHKYPKCLRLMDDTFKTEKDKCDELDALISAGEHSPMIGVAIDGYPIYGPIGWVSVDASVAKDSKVLVSSYTGHYVENKPSLISGSGDLDECNGIFSPTPEFPSGVYHYVMSVEPMAGFSGKRVNRKINQYFAYDVRSVLTRHNINPSGWNDDEIYFNAIKNGFTITKQDATTIDIKGTSHVDILNYYYFIRNLYQDLNSNGLSSAGREFESMEATYPYTIVKLKGIPYVEQTAEPDPDNTTGANISVNVTVSNNSATINVTWTGGNHWQYQINNEALVSVFDGNSASVYGLTNGNYTCTVYVVNQNNDFMATDVTYFDINVY
jgi:hypothetical protein